MGRGRDDERTVEVAGRRVRLTHPDKVMYPEAGGGPSGKSDDDEPRTKGAVADYYRAVAEALCAHASSRPATRMRWPEGTGGEMFVEKNLPAGAPDWLTTVTLAHREHEATYPVLDSAATLVWTAQMAALELHVPQWSLGPDELTAGGVVEPGPARRLVVDLDPGPGVDLDQTARIALRVRELLDDAGLESWPVTSGSKGIHVYARLPRPVGGESASRLARTVAEGLAEQTPDLVTATMKKTERRGRVFVDWSQNNPSKTTVVPYSLRGGARPFAAAPRAWDELEAGGLWQLTGAEVVERLDREGDLLAGLSADVEESTPAPEPVVDLDAYRRKRDPENTPEPFGDEGDDEGTSVGRSTSVEDDDRPPIFVIQEHHARSVHYDVRLEHDGVLASWAVPKNLPLSPGVRRLAVRTEDHPMSYADFEGRIPKGQYGGGEVEIWDRGTIEVTKWRRDEILVRLRGEHVDGAYAFIRTGDGRSTGDDDAGARWIVQRREDDADEGAGSGGGDGSEGAHEAGRSGEAGGPAPDPASDDEDFPTRPDLPAALRDPRPMLPTDRKILRLTSADWVYEQKWDGYRAMVTVIGGRVRVSSRRGQDLTDRVPGLEGLPSALAVDAVLDAEMVALDERGRASFSLLSRREAGGEDAPVSLVMFDVLWVDGTSLLRTRWERRREVLDELAPRLREVSAILVPEPLGADNGDDAMKLASEAGAEGVVAKRRDAHYFPGRRTATWLKQPLRERIEAVVGGWRPGSTGSRGLGSLLLGVPSGDHLTYLGRVGSGLRGAVADQLLAELEKSSRERSPFGDDLPRDVAADARFVLPKLVVEVEFHGRTERGLLRQPVLVGLRRDKLPGDV